MSVHASQSSPVFTPVASPPVSTKPLNVNQEQWFQMINPIIDSLQYIYADQIEINIDAFEAIKITATDMVVSQKGVPYTVMVPSFPIITTDNRLDYGSKSD